MEPSERAELKRNLIRLADGDRSAFEPVFTTTLPLLRRLGARLIGDPADADDAAQEALLKVFARAGEYDRERDALPWILAIGAYECRTVRNKKARRREAPATDATEPVGRADGPEELLLTQELRDTLAEIVGSLSPRDVETIAAWLDREKRGALAVRADTFRKRLERALGRVREAWSERHG